MLYCHLPDIEPYGMMKTLNNSLLFNTLVLLYNYFMYLVCGNLWNSLWVKYAKVYAKAYDSLRNYSLKNGLRDGAYRNGCRFI